MIDELLPGLFRIEIPLPDSPLKTLNSYLFKSSERNLIVDTGFNRQECFDAMDRALKKLDVDLSKTDFFITHLHADHFGLVEKLKTETSTVYFNRPDAEILDGWQGFEEMFKYAEVNGFPDEELKRAFSQHPGHKFATKWHPELKLLDEGSNINVGNFNLQCIETPGHTLGHTCLYDSDSKVFITGDHILGDITPNIQGWSDQQNMLKYYLESLDKVYNLDVKYVLPGHRNLIEDYQGRIDQLKNHHEKRLDETLVILGEGQTQAYGIASRMSWDIRCDSWDDFPAPQKWFATGEAIAHLRYLEEEKRVLRTTTETATTYSLISV